MKTFTKTIKKQLRAFITDADGHVVIAQTPNAPLIGWFVLVIASLLITEAPLHGVLVFFSSAFLFTWAYLELTQGVNGLRRTFGAAVLVFLVVARFWWGGGDGMNETCRTHVSRPSVQKHLIGTHEWHTDPPHRDREATGVFVSSRLNHSRDYSRGSRDY